MGCTTYIGVTCCDCGAEWKKRADSIKDWQGRCRRCNNKRTANMPHVREAQRVNGREVMARVGKLPSPKLENRKRGSAHYNWRGGIAVDNRRERWSVAMVAWRKFIMERDDHTCQVCGQRGGNLNADHILPFSLHPDLRLDPDNGRTLCESCHRKFGALTRKGILIRQPSHVRPQFVVG